jgi:hypothetical protein
MSLPQPPPVKPFELLIRETATGSCHSVTVYDRSLPAAIATARQTWPDLARWHVGALANFPTRRIVCTGCGADKILAFGANALTMSRVAQFQAAMKLNWTPLPKMLCPVCVEMNYRERDHMSRYLADPNRPEDS